MGKKRNLGLYKSKIKNVIVENVPVGRAANGVVWYVTVAIKCRKESRDAVIKSMKEGFFAIEKIASLTPKGVE
jgi:hypothetical protein